MTCVINKYRLQLVPRQVIELPALHDVLWVGQRDGEVWLVARVNTALPLESRVIEIVHTGDEAPFKAPHLGSFSEGEFLWHAFDVTNY